MSNELSMKIIYYKKLKKMTNETLAEATGLPVGTISRIASGRTKEPTLKTLRLIAKALDCTVDDLQSGGTVEPYYLEQETAQIAQEIYEKNDLRILFDATRKFSPEDIQAVIAVAKAIQSTKR